MAILLAACQQSSGLPATLVQVANASQSDATFEWHSSGILGTGLLSSSGSDPILACNPYQHGFDAGDYEIEIVTGAGTRTFSLPSRSERREVWIVIKSDASVEMVPESVYPSGPPCGP